MKITLFKGYAKLVLFSGGMISAGALIFFVYTGSNSVLILTKYKRSKDLFVTSFLKVQTAQLGSGPYVVRDSDKPGGKDR